jgi:glycogen operon protein
MLTPRAGTGGIAPDPTGKPDWQGATNPGRSMSNLDTTPRPGVRQRLPFPTEQGRHYPLGAVPDAAGVNFALFSEHATSVELLLFDRHDAEAPFQVIGLDPETNRTFVVWHVYVRGLGPGAVYAYRVDGPRGPDDQRAGHRFDPQKVLIDPYARGLVKDLWQRGDACVAGDNLATSLRSVVIAEEDWEDDRPRRPMSETIIYEMHVGGFTRSPTAGVAHPGTFAGVIEKIPFLKALGVTAVELLPILDFEDSDVRVVDGVPLTNFWGYSTMGCFATHEGYCVNPEQGRHAREFRDLVQALHREGIEVILDVVFNHTDEGNDRGPVYSFKGIDNGNYYYLVPDDGRYYVDDSGCGNTLKCNHPIVTKYLVEVLEYWVRAMHVDGFRFDEAAVLTRGEQGATMDDPPVVWQIELSDVLAETKVIAEAWDAAGAYEIGHYPGYRWAEWNGPYRDTIRRFVKGDPGLVGAVAARIAGSADLYQARGHLPINSINFVTCHDGFTLNDLVSYDAKHNEGNGEDNRDGVDDNLSWNCGTEGPTDDPAIEALRRRQIKNFATILMVSRGVPMILAGDEVRRTQRGNNNAYCQDNEVGWFDWLLAERNQDLLRFWSLLIGFRKANSTLHRPDFFTGRPDARGVPDVSWHGTRLDQPGWDDPDARALALTLGGLDGGPDLHVMLNMYWEPLDFEIPPIAGSRWRRALDTSLESPADFAEPGEEPLHDGDTYSVAGRSAAVLIATPLAGTSSVTIAPESSGRVTARGWS